MDLFGLKISKEGIYNISKREESITKARYIGKNKAVNEIKRKSKKKAKKLEREMRKQALSRAAVQINVWKNARVSAESILMPNNTQIITVFRDIEIDAHLWALMQTIRLKVMANKFQVYDSSDNVDEEATEVFQKKWFRNIIKEVVDSDFYGFSLVQLGDIVNNCFTDSYLVPREYVVQQKRGVKKTLGDPMNLIPFDSPQYVNWIVPIGEERNLGILDKAAPLVIKKKEVLSAWSEAAELFGMPLRIGKTNINNPENKSNMENMLENMGEAAWGVFDTEDDIELKETSKTDFSNMYDKFIERVNSELSKLVLLQTGTTDEKAFVGSANVHENILKDVIESYIIRVEDLTNEVLMPICERHGIVKLGTYIKANNEQKLSPKELFDVVKDLLSHYNVPEDWILENFEVPVEKKEEVKPEEIDPKKEKTKPITDPDASLSTVMNSVSELYKGVLKSCDHE